MTSSWRPLRSPGGLAPLIAAAYATLVLLRVLSRHDILVLPVALAAIVFAIERSTKGANSRSGAHLRFGLLLGSTLLLLAGAIGQLWIMGYEGRSAVIGGVIPWSDSSDYTSDALRLVHGTHLSSYGTRRPLFPVVLGCILRATGEDFRATVVLLSVIGALALTSATCAVWRTHGPKAAFVLYAVLILFERRWAGLLQTEHLGFPLGAFAFVLSWRALDLARTSPRRPWLLASSLLVLGLGLFARPGPFFVLPAILAWAWWTAADRKRTLFLGASAIALSYLVNTAVVRGLGTGNAFNDYPAILYGLAHDEDFAAMYREHPEIFALPEDEVAPAAYRLIGSYVVEHPGRLISGPGASSVAYVASPYGLFSLVFYDPDDHVFEDGALVRAVIAEKGYLGLVGYSADALGTFSLVNLVVMAIFGALFVILGATAYGRGFVAWRRGTLDQHTRFLLAANLGVLASTPFLPPWTTPVLQTACSTMPFIVTFGAVAFFGTRSTVSSLPAPGLEWAAPCLLGTAMVIVLLVVAFPRSTPEASTRAECSAPDGAYLEVFAGTKMDLGGDGASTFTTKSRADFATNLDFLRKHNPEVVAAIEAARRPDLVLAYAYDVCKKEAKLVIDDTGTLRSADGYTSLRIAKVGSSSVYIPVIRVTGVVGS